MAQYRQLLHGNCVCTINIYNPDKFYIIFVKIEVEFCQFTRIVDFSYQYLSSGYIENAYGLDA